MRNYLYINYPIQINDNLWIYDLKHKLDFLEKKGQVTNPYNTSKMSDTKYQNLNSNLIKGMICNILMYVGMQFLLERKIAPITFP